MKRNEKRASQTRWASDGGRIKKHSGEKGGLDLSKTKVEGGGVPGEKGGCLKPKRVKKRRQVRKKSNPKEWTKQAQEAGKPEGGGEVVISHAHEG